MAEHVWSVPCRRVIVDQITQAASLIDTFEGLEYVVPPGQPEPNLSAPLPLEINVVTLWTRSDPAKGEKTRQRLRVSTPAPAGDERIATLQPAELDIDLVSARNHRNVVT